MITLPNTFHCGFNTGFNVAVAINFAAPGYLHVKWNRLFCGRSPQNIHCSFWLFTNYSSPKRMIFWKSSKKPLPSLPLILKNNVAIYFQFHAQKALLRDIQSERKTGSEKSAPRCPFDRGRGGQKLGTQKANWAIPVSTSQKGAPMIYGGFFPLSTCSNQVD